MTEKAKRDLHKIFALETLGKTTELKPRDIPESVTVPAVTRAMVTMQYDYFMQVNGPEAMSRTYTIRGQDPDGQWWEANGVRPVRVMNVVVLDAEPDTAYKINGTDDE